MKYLFMLAALVAILNRTAYDFSLSPSDADQLFDASFALVVCGLFFATLFALLLGTIAIIDIRNASKKGVVANA